tara:strand:+ start:211 stop:492 length:282 start_codon:yes stop_codon:yes gene_type:complete
MTQAWRSKKYHCVQLTGQAGSFSCSLKLCDDDDVLVCCTSCKEYKGKDRGLGDTVKRIASAAGVKPCGGCQKRREALNKLTEKLYSKGKPNDS